MRAPALLERERCPVLRVDEACTPSDRAAPRIEQARRELPLTSSQVTEARTGRLRRELKLARKPPKVF